MLVYYYSLFLIFGQILIKLFLKKACGGHLIATQTHSKGGGGVTPVRTGIESFSNMVRLVDNETNGSVSFSKRKKIDRSFKLSTQPTF